MSHSTDIGCQLHNLSNILKRRLEHSKAFSQLDDTVTRNNGWILAFLADHKNQDIFQKDIEDAFCIRRSTVSKVIRLMEEKGFIERQSVDYDARLKKLVLTPEGEHIHHLLKKKCVKQKPFFVKIFQKKNSRLFFGSWKNSKKIFNDYTQGGFL